MATRAAIQPSMLPSSVRSSYTSTKKNRASRLSRADTTNLAAEATWEVLQGFLGALPKLDNKIKSKSFNLWTESYGGYVSFQASRDSSSLLANLGDSGITDQL